MHTYTHMYRERERERGVHTKEKPEGSAMFEIGMSRGYGTDIYNMTHINAVLLGLLGSLCK